MAANLEIILPSVIGGLAILGGDIIFLIRLNLVQEALVTYLRNKDAMDYLCYKKEEKVKKIKNTCISHLN